MLCHEAKPAAPVGSQHAQALDTNQCCSCYASWHDPYLMPGGALLHLKYLALHSALLDRPDSATRLKRGTDPQQAAAVPLFNRGAHS